jgi:hypothetical protein
MHIHPMDIGFYALIVLHKLCFFFLLLAVGIRACCFYDKSILLP